MGRMRRKNRTRITLPLKSTIPRESACRYIPQSNPHPGPWEMCTRMFKPALFLTVRSCEQWEVKKIMKKLEPQIIKCIRSNKNQP